MKKPRSKIDLVQILEAFWLFSHSVSHRFCKRFATALRQEGSSSALGFQRMHVVPYRSDKQFFHVFSPNHRYKKEANGFAGKLWWTMVICRLIWLKIGRFRGSNLHQVFQRALESVLPGCSSAGIFRCFVATSLRQSLTPVSISPKTVFNKGVFNILAIYWYCNIL